MRAKSRARNAFHSVTMATASAPSMASYGPSHQRTSASSFFAAAIPWGS